MQVDKNGGWLMLEKTILPRLREHFITIVIFFLTISVILLVLYFMSSMNSTGSTPNAPKITLKN